MIYHLFEALKDFDIPGQGLMQYLSFRAIMAFISSLLVSLIVGKHIIHWLQRKQIGESIRDLGLEGQLQKKGTPTMGGIIIIISILAGVLLFCKLNNIYILLLSITVLWLGGLGFTDDYIKVFKHDKNGLSERGKLLAQIALGFVIAITVCFSDSITIREKVQKDTKAEALVDLQDPSADDKQEAELWTSNDIVKSTKTTIPFVKNHEFDYQWLSPFGGLMGRYCKWAIYVLMIVLVITACSNSTNLTDGMDGLATGTSALAGVVLGIFAWLSGNTINSDYLNIMYIPGSGEIAVFMAAFVGALIGFLWYNSFPAQVFMGDTGSLALGGVIGVCAVLIRKELLLPILCGVFFVEALSVIIQRTYFKYTRKKYGEGRRVFRMAPLHHHFQKVDVEALIRKPVVPQPEAKIVTRFWTVALLLSVFTIALLKIR